jgi:DNA replication protein DnaC
VVAVAGLVREYAARGPEWLAWTEMEWQARDLILDDLGTPIESAQKAFGNPCPVAGIIDGRYDLWQRVGRRLYVSSNLSEQQRNEAYDGGKAGRIADRMGEMMTKVPCAWASFRVRNS